LSGSPVIDRHDPVFEDARLQPFLDQADDTLVADPVFQEADQPFSADAAEEVLDVGVKKSSSPSDW
jgi:site-specific DNA recombinase